MNNEGVGGVQEAQTLRNIFEDRQDDLALNGHGIVVQKIIQGAVVHELHHLRGPMTQLVASTVICVCPRTDGLTIMGSELLSTTAPITVVMHGCRSFESVRISSMKS